MSFTPPCCPRSGCPASKPSSTFVYATAGTYVRRCDGRLVQRFRCASCKLTFSGQTFRLDYRFRKPELDKAIFESFVSKVSHRQIARVLRTRRPTVERRLRRFGEHARAFQEVLLEGKRFTGSFSLDEAESFETDRRLMPVTLPVLIERDSRFLVHLAVGALPARKATSPSLLKRRQELVAKHGKRKNGSRAAVKGCFEVLARHTDEKARVEVLTDLKASYPGILKEVFGKRPVAHGKTSSKEKRDSKNPLFAINHTLAMLRDGVSRLVRRTWCHAKLRERLQLHAWIYAAWRNFVRYVSNERRTETPAIAIGVEKEAWELTRLLRWRGPFALLLKGQ